MRPQGEGLPTSSVLVFRVLSGMGEWVDNCLTHRDSNRTQWAKTRVGHAVKLAPRKFKGTGLEVRLQSRYFSSYLLNFGVSLLPLTSAKQAAECCLVSPSILVTLYMLSPGYATLASLTLLFPPDL